MRRLLPMPDADVAAIDAYELGQRRPVDGRPWLLVNMIVSVDGATAVDGVSGALGGPADKEVFHALRSLPDVILVAAGTVRAEHYGPPQPTTDVQRRRAERGQRRAPRLAIVTRSLDLDPDAPLFRDAAEDARPIVVTTTDAASHAPDSLRAVADIRAAGTGQVDLGAALRHLHADGHASTVLCEGGPSLNGALIAAGLVDEVCLSLSPILVGGSSPRLAHGADAPGAHLALTLVLEQDEMLFLDYRRSLETP